MPTKKSNQCILPYTAGIIASLTLIGYGCLVSWSSPALVHLTSNKSEFPVSENAEAAWIASLVNVGMVLGYMVNASIIDKLGRKRSLLLLAFPQIIGWMSIIFARNWIVLCISRVIAGIGYGGGICATNAYLGEIGNQNNRGIFLYLMKLSLNVGILYAMILGAFLSYNTMNLVLLSLPLIYSVTFPFMPDSSHFAEKPEEIVYSWKAEQEKGNRLTSLFTVKKNRRALMIVALCQATEAISGHAAIMAYTQEILDYSPSSLPSKYETLVFGSVKIIASFFSTQIVERIDRRVLFLGSGCLAAAAEIFVGIFFFVKFNMKVDVSSISWFPLLGIIFFEVVGNAGIGSIGFVFSAELFSPDVKGVGITVSYIVYDALAFFVKFMFYSFINAFGISGTFFFFSTCCFVATGLVYYLAPETRGRSLKEIQELLGSRKMDNG